MSQRENGFYWVNHKDIGEWEVARWDGLFWNCTEGFELDEDELKVDERRIVRGE